MQMQLNKNYYFFHNSQQVNNGVYYDVLLVNKSNIQCADTKATSTKCKIISMYMKKKTSLGKPTILSLNFPSTFTNIRSDSFGVFRRLRQLSYFYRETGFVR